VVCIVIVVILLAWLWIWHQSISQPGPRRGSDLQVAVARDRLHALVPLAHADQTDARGDLIRRQLQYGEILFTHDTQGVTSTHSRA